MIRRLWVLLIVSMLLFGTAKASFAGRYVLAFWRETGFNEKGGIGGNHVINVHVWDENGNSLSGKHIYTGTLDMGATDSNGQVELAIYEPNAYPLKVVDGSNTSDETPGFSSTRAPDWGHYCFECGFIYKSDTSSLPVFDTSYYGIFNSSSADYACNNIQMSAPCTKSMAFYSTKPDAGFYCSDAYEGSSSVTSVGQTFKANGNRVVACKFHAMGSSVQYTVRIREGGPTGAYIGTAATSPLVGTYDYSKTLTKWGLQSVQVVPGNTYYLEITKPGGGSFNVSRVISDNYPYGAYYEGTTAFNSRELRGEVICATYGPTADTSAISGYVKNSGGVGISGASVTTDTGGYSASTAADGSYTINGVTAGSYSVTASKTGYGSQTNTNVQVTAGQTAISNFTLTCLAPAITTQPLAQTRTVGQSAIFSVSVSGTPPFTYQWRKDGVSIPGATAFGYTIHSVSAANQANYDCVVSNNCGSVTTDPAMLYVNTGVLGAWDADKVWSAASNPTKLSATKWALEAGTSTTENWGTSYKLGANVFDRNGQMYAMIADSNGNTSNNGKNKYRSDGEGWSIDNTKTTAIKLGFYAIENSGAYPVIYIRTSSIGAQIRYDSTAQAWVPATGAVKDSLSPAGLIVASQTWHYIRFQMDPAGSWQAWLNEDPSQRMWGTANGGGGGPYIQFGCLGDTPGNIEFGLDFVAWGQGTGIAAFGTGAIIGTVRDAQGNLLPGAAVSTTSGGYSVTSGSNGGYSFSSVATGIYDLVASKPGYVSQTITGKSVSMGQTVGVNFTLARSATTVSKVAELKLFADGEYVKVTGKVVTANFANGFYIEDNSRESGIKVTGASAIEETTVTVTGTLSTVAGERVIENAVIE